MSQTLALATELLKNVYEDQPHALLNDECRIYALMEESAEERALDGNFYVQAIHITRSNAFKATAEGGYIPNASRQGYENFTISPKYIHAEIGLTVQALKQITGGRGSFTSALESEMDRIVIDLKRGLNRMMFGDGNGILARLNGAAGGSATLDVDDPGGVTGSQNGARYIKPGMVIAFHDASPSNNTPNAVRTVDSVSSDGTQITVDATVSSGDGPDDGVITMGVNRDSTLEGSWQLEPLGLLALVDDGTYLTTLNGLSRSTYPILKAQVKSNVGNLDEYKFDEMLDLCDEAASGEPDVMVCHHSVHREVRKMDIDDRRFTGDQVANPDAGLKSNKKREQKYSGYPFLKERDCPYGQIFFLNKSELEKFVVTPGEWADEDGAILRNTQGKDNWTAFYRMFFETHTKRPNVHGVMRGVNATIGSIPYAP